MPPKFLILFHDLLRLYKQKNYLNLKQFFFYLYSKLKLTIKMKSNLIEKINEITAFEISKITDEIKKMTAINLKCKNLIKKELFSDVYRCSI